MQRNKLILLSDYKPSEYLIDKTDIHFDLDEQKTKVKTTLDVRKNPDAEDSTNDLVLNGEGFKLDSIAVDGVKLNAKQYKVTKSTLTIKDVPEACQLQIETHMSPVANKTLEGLYLSKGVFITMCEAEGFRKLTYFIDRPDILSSYTTTLTADAKKYPFLLSNGDLVKSGKLKNGKHWATWSDPIPKPSYLFVLAAGKFDIAEDVYTTKTGRDIKIQVYVEKGKADQCGLAIDMLKKAMRWDEETYGREYDLDTYKIVSIHDFDASADENTGMNIFKSDCLLGVPANTMEHALSWIQSTVPHEYFHHWSGNRVTIRDWFQVSLKEGLTTFREQTFNEDTISAACRLDSVRTLREYQFPKDIFPAQAVAYLNYKEFQESSSSSIYSKGAEIFRMIQTVLGKPTFRKGMELYFDRYKGKAATFENYLDTMSEVSGKDLSSFLMWFRKPGTPHVTVSDRYNAKTKTYTLKVEQTCESIVLRKGEKTILPIPIRVGLLDSYGKPMKLFHQSKKPVDEKVLLLESASEEFHFTNVASKPIPSLLRGFSAPVILEYDYELDDLALLMKYDTDAFNRLECAKQYVSKTLLALIEEYNNEKTTTLPEGFVDNFKYVLEDKSIDPRFIASMFSIPSEIELAFTSETIDVDAIHAARACVVNTLAKDLKPLFLSTYTKSFSEAKGVEQSPAEQRQHLGRHELENACMYFLSRLPDTKIEQLLMKRFEAMLHTNISGSMSALQNIVDMDGKLSKKALDMFYDKWKDNPEYLRYWIEIQATSSAPHVVKHLHDLMQDDRFDAQDPLHAASLLFPFLANFSKCYSAEKSSYQILTDLCDKFGEEFSEVKNKIVEALESWKEHLDEKRQALIGDCVDHIEQNEPTVKHKHHAAKDHIHQDEEELSELSFKQEPVQEIEVRAKPRKKDKVESQAETDDVVNDVDLSRKSKRQIHMLLSKQGMFKHKPELAKEISEKAYEQSAEEFRHYAKSLLR